MKTKTVAIVHNSNYGFDFSQLKPQVFIETKNSTGVYYIVKPRLIS